MYEISDDSSIDSSIDSLSDYLSDTTIDSLSNTIPINTSESFDKYESIDKISIDSSGNLIVYNKITSIENSIYTPNDIIESKNEDDIIMKQIIDYADKVNSIIEKQPNRWFFNKTRKSFHE